MNCLRRFLLHCGGVSATEFALAAPMLALMTVGVATSWTYSTQLLAMRSAVKSGANYVLQGGTDLTVTQNAVLNAWSQKPADANVQAIRQCTCAGVVSSCTVVCTGTGSIPNMSVIITATGSVDAPVFDMMTAHKTTATRQETIRVR